MKKHNTIKSLCVAVAMIFAGITANAQLETSIYLNGALPTGEMGGKATLDPLSAPLLTKDNIGTTAAVGFGVGGRASYHFDVGFGEVAPFVNIDFQWNQIKGAYRDDFAKESANAKASQYFNLPILIGVNYRYELTDIFKPFAEFGIGTDFFMISAERTSTSKLVYSVGNALAWEIGAGCFFGSHVSAGIHYYGLGKHRITYNEKRTDIGGMTVDQVDALDPTTVLNKVELRNIGSLMLRIGFHF